MSESCDTCSLHCELGPTLVTYRGASGCLQCRFGFEPFRRIRGATMKFSKSIGISAALASASAALTAVAAQAGGDKIAFPENYASGVLYTTVDRAANQKYREPFVSP